MIFSSETDKNASRANKRKLGSTAQAVRFERVETSCLLRPTESFTLLKKNFKRFLKIAKVFPVDFLKVDLFRVKFSFVVPSVPRSARP